MKAAKLAKHALTVDDYELLTNDFCLEDIHILSQAVLDAEKSLQDIANCGTDMGLGFTLSQEALQWLLKHSSSDAEKE